MPDSINEVSEASSREKKKKNTAMVHFSFPWPTLHVLRRGVQHMVSNIRPQKIWLFLEKLQFPCFYMSRSALSLMLMIVCSNNLVECLLLAHHASKTLSTLKVIK